MSERERCDICGKYFESEGNQADVYCSAVCYEKAMESRGADWGEFNESL